MVSLDKAPNLKYSAQTFPLAGPALIPGFTSYHLHLKDTPVTVSFPLDPSVLLVAAHSGSSNVLFVLKHPSLSSTLALIL